MRPSIGIRRETKSPWERRSPVTPDLARHLVEATGVHVMIQPSARRVYADSAYTRAGAAVTTDLDEANIVLGVKEIPPELLKPGFTYLFFSHVIKGQSANMPMLRRLMELGCTLIDYELIADSKGRRLVFFGRFAGLAGMIDTLWVLGQRLAENGVKTPFASLEPAHAYDGLEAAKAAVRKAGERLTSSSLPRELAPLVIGIAGYGNVAKGAREILAELPTRDVPPGDLATLIAESSPNRLYQTTFKEEHLVVPVDTAQQFNLQDYYRNPQRYRSDFARYLPSLTVLVNCNYWDQRYPRLVTLDELKTIYGGPSPARLQVIGDLGCDVGGAVQCNVRSTDPGDPAYVYDVSTDEARRGFSGPGPAVLAVDILPSELPLEASEEFAKALGPFLSNLARADFDLPLDEIGLPPEIARAIIVHRGELTPAFRHLQDHLETGPDGA
jgi:hypothetical protein